MPRIHSICLSHFKSRLTSLELAQWVQIYPEVIEYNVICPSINFPHHHYAMSQVQSPLIALIPVILKQTGFCPAQVWVVIKVLRCSVLSLGHGMHAYVFGFTDIAPVYGLKVSRISVINIWQN